MYSDKGLVNCSIITKSFNGIFLCFNFLIIFLTYFIDPLTSFLSKTSFKTFSCVYFATLHQSFLTFSKPLIVRTLFSFINAYLFFAVPGPTPLGMKIPLLYIPCKFNSIIPGSILFVFSKNFFTFFFKLSLVLTNMESVSA